MILSLFWAGFTERAAIASMLAGFFMTIASKFLLQDLHSVGEIFAALETMPHSFMTALLVGYWVSKVWPDSSLREHYKEDLKHCR